ncbi:MAG: hypothetical protein KKC75_05560 [Nanoarchaeota archaeon]|nr:hypothetical protein [Nanoarchaeota archaeon]
MPTEIPGIGRWSAEMAEIEEEEEPEGTNVEFVVPEGAPEWWPTTPAEVIKLEGTELMAFATSAKKSIYPRLSELGESLRADDMARAEDKGMPVEERIAHYREQQLLWVLESVYQGVERGVALSDLREMGVTLDPTKFLEHANQGVELDNRAKTPQSEQ